MASKRSRPVDNTPSAESSGEEVEEEEEAASKQQQQQQPNEEQEEKEEEEEEEQEEEEEEEEGEEEEEEADEEEKEEPKTPVTKQQQQQLDSDNEEQEEESDCDITHAPSAVIKPTRTQLPKKEKQKKQQQDDDVVEEKKGIINRVWSFNDEIIVLQGIIRFKKQHKKDPSSSSDEFYNFVKNDLGNGKFTKTQLMDKVRRLKKKYKNHLSKSSHKDPEISNPHELKSFHLSKAIWGDLTGKTKVTVDENVGNGVDVVASGVRAAKKMKVDLGEEKMKVDVVMAESNEGGDDFKRLYPNLMNAFKGDGMCRVPLLDDLKSYLNLVGSSELKESDKKWKEIHVAEFELYLSRIALVEETTLMVMDALKSAQR